MEKLELYSYQSGYWTKYNDSIDASVSNNFAAATFRFAHSLIPVGICQNMCTFLPIENFFSLLSLILRQAF